MISKITKITALLFIVGIVGWISFFFALNKLPWDTFLANFIYFISVSQGVIAISVILRIGSARWSSVFYRLSGAVSLSFLPIALVMLVTIFIFKGSIFYWSAEAGIHPWYNSVLFIARNTFALLLFYAFNWVLFKNSTVKDNNLAQHSNMNFVLLGFFLLLSFVVSQTIISWDMAMTLDPEYADTMYAVLFISSSILCGTAALVLLMTFFKKNAGVKVFKSEHFSNMGQLLLGLTIFTAYLRWSQFFTIWFGHLPEETKPYYLRIFSSYKPVYIVMILMTVFIPFFGLIFKKIRTSERALNIISASILIGMWFDRYLLTAPALVEQKKVIAMSVLNPVNILFTVGILSGFIFLLLNFISKKELLTITEEEIEDDPFIANAQGWQ